MTDTNFLNKKEAIERIGGDIDIYQSLLETFLDYYEKDLNEAEKLHKLFHAKAESVLSNSDMREHSRKTAHKIKGAAFTIGADILGAAASEIELFLKEKNNGVTETNIERFKILLYNFTESYSKTILEIKKIN
ncbi:Hpt domain-containing protein [Treponema pedis]|uniref:Hpt domain-containing protein n=1 Tax=Treponema pedis TaxID=409322 RepID=A0A7S7AW16_9SPIR|nr:Hpt domain-containing protein [Treponema pedis]QOW60229.1 Hpt domain-containing protein [Treponema pedis]